MLNVVRLAYLLTSVVVQPVLKSETGNISTNDWKGVAARVGAKADELQLQDDNLSRITAVQRAIKIVKEEDKKCQ